MDVVRSDVTHCRIGCFTSSGGNIDSIGEYGVTYLDQNGDLQTNENVAVIHDASDLNNSTLASGWYLFSGAWSLSNRINITGDVHIILEDGSDVEAPQGIDVSNNNLLTIYAQSTGSGTLEPLGMRVAQGSEAANGVLVVRLR